MGVEGGVLGIKTKHWAVRRGRRRRSMYLDARGRGYSDPALTVFERNKKEAEAGRHYNNSHRHEQHRHAGGRHPAPTRRNFTVDGARNLIEGRQSPGRTGGKSRGPWSLAHTQPL